MIKLFGFASIQLRPISDYDMLTVGRLPGTFFARRSHSSSKEQKKKWYSEPGVIRIFLLNEELKNPWNFQNPRVNLTSNQVAKAKMATKINWFAACWKWMEKNVGMFSFSDTSSAKRHVGNWEG